MKHLQIDRLVLKQCYLGGSREGCPKKLTDRKIDEEPTRAPVQGIVRWRNSSTSLAFPPSGDWHPWSAGRQKLSSGDLAPKDGSENGLCATRFTAKCEDGWTDGMKHQANPVWSNELLNLVCRVRNPSFLESVVRLRNTQCMPCDGFHRIVDKEKHFLKVLGNIDTA